MSKVLELLQFSSFAYVFALQKSVKESGGGGIRTLDTPLRGITDELFTAVPGRSIFLLSKPNSQKRCSSLFFVVCDGLVY